MQKVLLCITCNSEACFHALVSFVLTHSCLFWPTFMDMPTITLSACVLTLGMDFPDSHPWVPASLTAHYITVYRNISVCTLC